ncbi:helix-turn-helix transcriptional regulator [uncultured Sulfitobacter sp.]|uniref:helix-turn-helix domain-containing protein n=1 Tax=uncultured Sulfitobacter sp. TaxID=191468 RepID=UPI0025985DBA|nr:helix-turn-helix transcriptional regulator [uncultured Sulfitobacter sp.]
MKERPEEWQELVRKYAELGTIQKAADAMGICFSTARSRLDRMGVARQAKGYRTPEEIITGEECRAKRTELGLSQPALGELAGVTAVTISNFENGNRTPRSGTQKKIARALGIKSVTVTD